jgi:hypothetical protein
MRYYLLQKAITRKEIGKHSLQTEEVKDIDFIPDIPRIDQLHNLPNHHIHLTNDEFPKFEPRIKFRLKEGAKLTDSLNYPNMRAKGLLVSPKLKFILQQFNLMEHKFYPAQIYVENIQIEYFWFHQIAKPFQGINFIKSEIYYCFEDNEPILIQNEIKYREVFNKGLLKINKLIFNDNLQGYDVFYIPHSNNGSPLFITEPLFRALKKEKITGIEILEQEILFME